MQDFYYVTDWNKFNYEFEDVTFSTFTDTIGVNDDTVHVMFHTMDGYTASLPFDRCVCDEVMFVWGYDGEDLPADHGGPPRIVTPHKCAYKGAKWVSGVESLTESERGRWEKWGYSNTTNPWNEEWYS